jgi:antitoxin HicB
MLNYPVTLSRDTNGEHLVDFIDLSFAHGAGDTEEEALQSAVDGLITAIEMLLDDRRIVPLPSAPAEGQRTVALPALETAKVLLWNELLGQDMRKADLVRKLGVHAPQVDRLFDLRHSSKLDQVEQAAKALGRSLSVELV